jgi:uncharacterized protein
MDKERLVVMVKDPTRTMVKNRLAEHVGRVLAETLYRSFVTDILKTVRDASLSAMVAFSPPGSRRSVEAWIGQDVPLMEQTGDDLGARMKNIFLDLFRDGCSRVVVVGSDIPDLGAGVIEEAFHRLHENDAVIGPALDGGYYLAGFTKEGFLPDIFEGITWSTETVFRETAAILLQGGRTVHVLPRLSDVDTVTDLRALFARHEHTEFRGSNTMACIAEHRAKVFS